MKRVLLLSLLGLGSVVGDRAKLGTEELERYFENRVVALEGQLEEVSTEQWKREREVLRGRLLEMLGLHPMPERSPLQAVVTGRVRREGVVVERLHFQSSPGLYVTANFYLPSQRKGKLPAVLYVCGHGRVKIDGVSYGNKAHYQHHGAWFARNGYACLIIDTLQLGEIEGVHHGTYSHDRWWWLARGYTPAGVEAWNCMRALDYLQTREEVDGSRLGVTGRSGGGAYSWWIAATDERIKAAVPVAGIASLRNHVVDGCVEGHCDCMFHLNTYRWDFEQVAALVSPRPLLISNTDKDPIFPLDGVYQVYRPVRKIYQKSGAEGKLGLNIEEGGHKDTQPLRTSAFHWMNRHLKGDPLSKTFEMAAVKLFQPQELKVFEKLPKDEINSRIDELFVSRARSDDLPATKEEWKAWTGRWAEQLRGQSFRGWPVEQGNPKVTLRVEAVVDGIQVSTILFQSEPDVSCSIDLFQAKGSKLSDLERIELRVVGQDSEVPEWAEKVERPEDAKHAIAYFYPRGVGRHAWAGMKNQFKARQIRRRFAMIGQTLDGMRVYDIQTAVRLLRERASKEVTIGLGAQGVMAGNVLYASLLLEDPVVSLTLRNLPTSHRKGPIYLNVLKFMDLPYALAMAAERTPTTVVGAADPWMATRTIAQKLSWADSRLRFQEAKGRSD